MFADLYYVYLAEPPRLAHVNHKTLPVNKLTDFFFLSFMQQISLTAKFFCKVMFLKVEINANLYITQLQKGQLIYHK